MGKGRGEGQSRGREEGKRREGGKRRGSSHAFCFSNLGSSAAENNVFYLQDSEVRRTSNKHSLSVYVAETGQK